MEALLMQNDLSFKLPGIMISSQYGKKPSPPEETELLDVTTSYGILPQVYLWTMFSSTCRCTRLIQTISQVWQNDPCVGAKTCPYFLYPLPLLVPP